MLPVCQTLLEGTTKLWAGLGILQGDSKESQNESGALKEMSVNIVNTNNKNWGGGHFNVKLDLQTVRQSVKLSPAVLAKPQSLLLSFGVFSPGKEERGGEEEASLKAPVCWVLCADGRSYGGWSNGLGTLERETGEGNITSHIWTIEKSTYQSAKSKPLIVVSEDLPPPLQTENHPQRK